MEQEQMTFGSLREGDVFFFETREDICIKETFPGQNYYEDCPPPNYFKLMSPKFYCHSGDRMSVVKLITVAELWNTLQTMKEAGLID